MRLEHLDSLHAVLTDMMAESPSTVPNKTELMSIYGRVSDQGGVGLDRQYHLLFRSGLPQGSRVVINFCTLIVLPLLVRSRSW